MTESPQAHETMVINKLRQALGLLCDESSSVENHETKDKQWNEFIRLFSTDTFLRFFEEGLPPWGWRGRFDVEPILLRLIAQYLHDTGDRSSKLNLPERRNDLKEPFEFLAYCWDQIQGRKGEERLGTTIDRLHAASAFEKWSAVKIYEFLQKETGTSEPIKQGSIPSQRPIFPITDLRKVLKSRQLPQIFEVTYATRSNWSRKRIEEATPDSLITLVNEFKHALPLVIIEVTNGFKKKMRDTFSEGLSFALISDTGTTYSEHEMKLGKKGNEKIRGPGRWFLYQLFEDALERSVNGSETLTLIGTDRPASDADEITDFASWGNMIIQVLTEREYDLSKLGVPMGERRTETNRDEHITPSLKYFYDLKCSVCLVRHKIR